MGRLVLDVLRDIRRVWRISWGLVLRFTVVTAAIQALLAGALVAVDALRRRRSKPGEGFPHADYPEVSLGDSDDRVTLYSYGDAVYEAMLEDIEKAEETIMLETFIWKGDALGRRFVETLARKAREGVKVCVIFDEFANLVVPAEFKRFPEEIYTLNFRPVNHPGVFLDLRTYFRDHRKLLVVDSRVGFVGGYNIGELYASGSWRDTHLRIEGTEARELENAFVDFWNTHRTGELPEITLGPGRNWRPNATLHRNDAYMRIFPIRTVYLEAIDRADSHIYISQAYFVPDRALRAALKEAAGRGVDVQVLLPWNSNHVVADWLGRRWFWELLESGVRIFGYKDIMIHSKTATIDGLWSTIGTANIDRFSLLGNYEVNLEVYSEQVASQMEEMFELDKTNAFELTREEWEQRPLVAKVVERALESLAPLV